MERTIRVWPSCFVKDFKMIVDVPDNVDAEEEIDSLLDALLNENLKYNCEWEFV